MQSITANEARSVWDYNPLTGQFHWRATHLPSLSGRQAGKIVSTGYITIGYRGKSFFAHRLAWLIVYGREPYRVIDHINGIRTDNRIINLREADIWQNNANRSMRRDNTSGYKGVSFIRKRNKFAAQISIPNSRPRANKHLGYFDRAEDAHRAYCNAAKSLYGEFANFG